MELQEERRGVRSVRNQQEPTHSPLWHKTPAGGPKRRALRNLAPACPSREGYVGLHNRQLGTEIFLRQYWGYGVHKPLAPFVAMAMSYGRVVRLPLPPPHTD